MRVLLLGLATALLVNSSCAQILEDVGEPVFWPGVDFSSDQHGDPGFYEEDYLSSTKLEELLGKDQDELNYDEELKVLGDLIDLEEDAMEEEEEDNFMKLLDVLADLEDTGEEAVDSEYPLDPENECEGFQCNPDIILRRYLEEQETSRRRKRSPSRRTSSSRRSSSSSTRRRTSSSSSSSSGSNSGSSSSRGGGGWWSRRQSSSGSSSSRGGSSTSRGSGSSSSGSSGSTSSSGNSGSTGSSGSNIGWNTGGSSGSKPSTGTAIAGGAGAGAAIGATSGSSSPGSSYPKQPSGGYPTGTQPAGGYPTGTQPVAGYPGGTRPAGGYPTGTNPFAGYPGRTRPAGGYPTGTNPVAGYPGGTQPAGGYPTGTNPVAGYPGGTKPAGGYPTGTNPVAGYPGGTRPAGGYPTGTNPVAGYPGGTRPGGGYPAGTNPVAGYPGQPSGSRAFGSSNQPYGGYPAGAYGGGHTGYQPYGSAGYGGYSTGSTGFGGFPSAGRTHGGYPSGGFGRTGLATGGFAAGAIAASSYPVGGFPMPKRKKSKKEKVKDVIKAAGTAYIAHKAYKKSNKFLSPFGHRSKGFGGGLGGGLMGAGALGIAGKAGKKILGAYVKIMIAKYALKFGASAAKAYFQYKLGVELDEYMVGKFVHRYHQNRVYGGSRWRHRTHYPSYDKTPGKEDNITLGEFCHRPCNESDKRVCQFSFEVHLYQTMSRACYNCPSNTTDCERPECVAADGTRRMVVAVNKAIPGPSIQVCAGDKVLVDVYNSLPSTSVTIHWHGLTLGPTQSVPNARATPFMDGAPGVTQCPISPGSGFRYSFDATDPGTHFWHAQTGFERGDGVFGPLVIHQPINNDPMQSIPEHMFLVNDWFHSPTQEKYVMKQNSGMEEKPKSILINGQGRHKHDDTGTHVPYFNFVVEKNKRYRLRIMNAASTNCPMTISVDSHDLILLSADGTSINPVNTSSVLVHPGERYDAMFSAEQEAGDDGALFWIRVHGGNDCQGLQQFASLQYLPTNLTATPVTPVPPTSNPSATPSKTHGMNDFTGNCGTTGQRCVSGLRASRSLPEPLKATKAAHTFYLAFSRRLIHNENFYSLLFYSISDDEADKRVSTPQINNLSFRGTSTPILVNQRPLKSENCSAEGVRSGHCTGDFCECIHVLPMSVGDIVDLVLIGEALDGSGMPHPVHLHGYKFWVLAQVDAASVPEVTIPASENYTLPEGMSREKVMRLDEEGRLTRYLESPVVKDTVAIPAGGYTVVRIAAENKGIWVLESQELFNSQAGMSLILQVGSEKDLPQAPGDFPTC